MPLLPLLAGLALAVVYIPWLDRAPSATRSLLKTLPIAIFALGAALAGAPLTAFALAACALGDLALSREGTPAFLAGMGAFALGHVLYITDILLLSEGAKRAIPLFAGGALLLLAASTEVWLRPHTGALRWPVRGYVAIITAMGLVAFSLPGAPLVAAGAAAFVLSDFLLALFLFRLPEESPLRGRVGLGVWITYIAAQALLSVGLLSLSGAG